MNNEELTKKIIEIDERTIKHDIQINNLMEQVDDVRDLTNSVHKMATSLEVLANTQKSSDKKLDALSKDVEEIKEKPAKNWENTVRLVFEIVLAAVVAIVLVKMGLK